MPLRHQIDQLIAAIRDPVNPNSLTAKALEVLGDSAPSAIPELIQLATNSDDTIHVRVQAIRTIGAIQEPSEQVVPALIDFLNNGDLLSRIYSARAISNISDASSPIIEALSGALSDDDPNVCRNAALSLAYLGEAAMQAVPDLIKGLNRDDIAGEMRESLLHIDPTAIAETCNPIESSYLFPSFTETKWSQKKQTAFSHLTQFVLSSDSDHTIRYDLPYPKYEYLFYLAQHHQFILHGSAKSDIDCLSPRQSCGALDEFGSQQAVFGTTDGIFVMYYAILDRSRIRGMDNGFFIERGLSGKSVRFYELAIDAVSLPEQPWVDGMIYILPSDYFNPDERYGEDNTVQFASHEPVYPVAKLPISLTDFPFLDWMSGFDTQAPSHKMRLLDNSICLRDVQYRPIRRLHEVYDS